MLTIVEEAAEGEALAQYGLATPRANVAIAVAGETYTLLIGDETPETTVWARDSARSLVFTVDAYIDDDGATYAPLGDSRMQLFRFEDGSEFDDFEITGTTDKVDNFVGLMRQIGLVEVGRTGVVGLIRGKEAI